MTTTPPPDRPTRPGSARAAVIAATRDAGPKRLDVATAGLYWLMTLPLLLGGSLGIALGDLGATGPTIFVTYAVLSAGFYALAWLLVDVLGKAR